MGERPTFAADEAPIAALPEALRWAARAALGEQLRTW
jgi:hypothetical protein